MEYPILLKCFKENSNEFTNELAKFIKDECDFPCDGFCGANCRAGLSCEEAMSNELWEIMRSMELKEGET
jgi:hypothetical protein